jgi:uncharacterized delta-60 repeat protein
MTNIGTAANQPVNSIAVQTDGKILVGGEFTTWNGTTVNRIVRLNSDGTRDTSFTTNTGTAANNNIYSIAVQSDGKILIGGAFTTWNGTTVNRIVRLNSDGTRDTSFTTNTGTGANSNILSIAVQSDGKILIGGAFTTFNGVTVNRIVRLNSDGTADASFADNTGNGANGQIYSIAVQSNGKILIGGTFTTFNSATVNRIVRLDSDGNADATFSNIGTAANNYIYSIAVQSDGKILIGGTFTDWDGVTVNRIVRLDSDGTRDTSFSTNTGTAANNYIYSIAVQSDGKIVIGGNFTAFSGVGHNRIIRLNSDGSPPPLNSFASGPVSSIAIQSDGKILVGGEFKDWNGVEVNRIVRLNSDGTVDTAFSANIGTAANDYIYSIAVQSDGKILIGGWFTEWNGAPLNRIVRLNSDGTDDTTFSTNIGTAANSFIQSIAVQSDGKILIGGFFSSWNGVSHSRIVRLNSNGTRDTTFSTNIGTAANDQIFSVAVQSDGKIVIGGWFPSWNGTTVQRIVRLNSDGTRDTAFTVNTGTGFSDNVQSVAIQTDGKIVIVGQFGFFNGVTANFIVRLNSDGTRDTTFTTNTGTGANNYIYSIAFQSNGKILVGGAFTTFNGVTVNRILRLNSDGTRDAAFTTNIGNNIISEGGILSIAIQTDNKILVGGSFRSFRALDQCSRNFVRIGGEDAS